MFITITCFEHYMGIESYKIDQELILKKDKNNSYDDEAIKVESENGATYGYVANSIDTVARGTHSAGYVYCSLKESQKCKVKFITQESVIAELI